MLTLLTTASVNIEASPPLNPSINNPCTLKLININGPILYLSYETYDTSDIYADITLESKIGNEAWSKSACTYSDNKITYKLLSSNTSYKFRITFDNWKETVYSNEINVSTPNIINYKTDAFTYAGEFKDGLFNGKGTLAANKNVIFSDDGIYTPDKYITLHSKSAAETAFSYSKGNINKNGSFSYSYPSTFEGKINNGKIIYGSLKIDNSLIYQGYFKDYKKSGQGMLYKPNSKIILSGLWENNGFAIAGKKDIDKVINFYIAQNIYDSKDFDFLITLKGNDKDLYGFEYYNKLPYGITRLTKDINSYNMQYFPSIKTFAMPYNLKLGLISIYASKIQADSKRLQSIKTAKSIIAQIIKPSMTDIQKELAIHDYIVKNTKYDYTNYKKNTIPQDSHTAYGALVKKTAVCDGYAQAAKLLLNTCGIECMVITGYGNNEKHAWNIVRIDDNYYQLDTTWDDDYTNDSAPPSYNYFNATDEQLSKDHIWDKSSTPVCSDTKYLFFSN